ncbi:MAG: prepilin-type N-terminal cleavage/methylation domain-containing protein [Nitrospirota bacterium]|nr:prepilin-type N-terminal cleavage/methylation domain-containing protein [Nitrospirota bacterium]
MNNNKKSIFSGGFTLIEVLVAIAITSIILMALYSTFFMSQKAVGTVGNSLLQLQEARGVLDILKREIEASYFSGSLKYTIFKIDDRDFYGRQASGITFTAYSPLMPGLARISYEVREEGGTQSLKKKVSSAYAPGGDAAGMELIEDMDSFTVEAKYDGKWVKTWDSALTMNFPDEVRITVVVKTGDNKKQVSISDIARTRIGRKIEWKQ